MTKYIVAFAVAITVLYLYAAHHPLPDSPLPLWFDAAGGALIITLPAVLLCRLVTRRIGGLRARGLDLVILFCAAGLYWGLSFGFTDQSGIGFRFRFWLNLTITSWATLFLPFVVSVAAIEWLQSCRGKNRERG